MDQYVAGPVSSLEVYFHWKHCGVCQELTWVSAYTIFSKDIWNGGLTLNRLNCYRSWWSLYDIEFCINFIFSGSEWTSGLKHYIHDQKNPSSNPTMCSAGLWDPTALQGSWWPLGQNQYPNEVINKGQEAVPSKVAQN